eukprot:GSChrysophyteH1.ASY1.ANO1.2490.1 assembled CDS
MSVRASDYVRKPPSPARSQQGAVHGSRKSGVSSWSLTFLLIAMLILSILVWLNFHIKTTVASEDGGHRHHGDQADGEDHQQSHLLHRVFGEDLGKRHPEGFTRESWSKKFKSELKEIDASKKFEGRMESNHERQTPNLASNEISFTNINKNKIHEDLNVWKSLRGSGDKAEKFSSFDSAVTSREKALEEIQWRQKLQESAFGRAYLNSIDFVNSVIAATYPDVKGSGSASHSHLHSHDGGLTEHSHEHAHTGHHDAESDFDHVHSHAHSHDGGLTQHSHEHSHPHHDAEEDHSGLYGSLKGMVTQNVGDLFHSHAHSHGEGTEMHTHVHGVGEGHHENEYEGHGQKKTSYLDSVQWINDLIDSTYPGGHSQRVASEEMAGSSSHSHLHSHDGGLTEHSHEHAHTGHHDAESDFDHVHSHAHSHDGGLTQHSHEHSHPHHDAEEDHSGLYGSLKGMVTQNVGDLFHSHAHSHGEGTEMHTHVHGVGEGHHENEYEGHGQKKTSYLDSVQWINDLIDSTYPGGHSQRVASEEMAGSSSHSHLHSHDGGLTEHSHEHRAEHHTTIGKTNEKREKKPTPSLKPDDHDDDDDDDTVHHSSVADAEYTNNHGHDHSAGSADLHQLDMHRVEDAHKQADEGSGASQKNSNFHSKNDQFRTRLLRGVRKTLREHPIHSIPFFEGQASDGNIAGHTDGEDLSSNIGMSSSIYDILPWLQKQPQCKNKPVFLSMANQVSDMYWQMIENYIYTLVKFGMSDCALMICVDDASCINKCKANNFPCYLFEYEKHHMSLPEIEKIGEKAGFRDKSAYSATLKPPVMELIAYLKLYHIPKALNSGLGAAVVLDLDVGFLRSPQAIVDYIDYAHYNTLDALMQQDVVFIMNRSEAGWKQWWTEPMPNIGVLLLKSTPAVISMFQTAWRDYYTTAKLDIRKNPGKDQNKVERGESDKKLKWRYIPVTEAVLLDKIFKFVDQAVELGGDATVSKVPPASLVHVTCFEKDTKLMGLKASNAFWNPFYYDPLRPTLTKKLLAFNKLSSKEARSDKHTHEALDIGYLNVEMLQQEIHSLVYLAIKLNRTLIIPNLLLEDARGPLKAALNYVDPKKSNVIQRPIYKGNALWPGFRVLHLKTEHNDPNAKSILRLQQVEPAYYWRVERDYNSDEDGTGSVPEPTIVSFTTDAENNLGKIEETLSAFSHERIPRLVVHILPDPENPTFRGAHGKMVHQQKVYISSTLENTLESIREPMKSEIFVKNEQQLLKKWASHSVGAFDSWDIESVKYQPLPALDTAEKYEQENKGEMTWGGLIGGHSDDVHQNARLCANIGGRMKGNRSCFGKCG